MKSLLAALLVALACSDTLLAQPRDRTLEKFDLALARTPALRMELGPDPPAPRTFGVFTLVPPHGRGEMIRVSVPIGALVSRAARSVAAANRRRHEADARREVQDDLARLLAGKRKTR